MDDGGAFNEGKPECAITTISAHPAACAGPGFRSDKGSVRLRAAPATSWRVTNLSADVYCSY
jgi:hypothetical protein